MNNLKFTFAKFTKKFVFIFCIILLFSSCKNFFHDLLPSEKNEILDFQVQYTNGSRSIKETPDSNNNITIIVPDDTDITKLIPVVSISENAQIIPSTIEYLNKIFPEKDLLTLAMDMYLARANGTFESWFINLVLENEGIKIPKLDMPINFSSPVFFIVISASGNYEFYTVTVKKENKIQDTDDKEDSSGSSSDDEDENTTPSDNFILSFDVDNQVGESKIYHSLSEINKDELVEDSSSIGDKFPYSGLVSFEVGADVDLKEILPVVSVSDGANILPLTQEYILSLGIGFNEMLEFYSGYTISTDIEKYVSSFLKKYDNITFPQIDKSINFSDTNVYFAVVSKDKSVKIYYIQPKQIELKPSLTKIIFSKLNNEFLCKDSIGTITDDMIKATCMHPLEMEFDYGLIPEFVYEGDRVTYTMQDGTETELISGVTKIPFTETNRICVVSVYRGSGNIENKIEYELYCPVEYDPDSIRSIIDFRFYKSKNTQIKSTVLASIHNEGDTGFITATVMYEGEVAPYELVADFVSPGTVTKNGTEVISGVTSENFEYNTQYLCTSKNGLYCRLYDISIKFMQIVTIEPIINSFEFPSYLNKDLSKDCVAQIDELTKTIRCEVLYHSPKPPYNLIPSFTSSGIVTCDGMTQTSGFSEQNFRYTNYYTVTTGDIELSTARYRIEVVFVKDDSSSCDILDFGFKIENNASLTSDVQATVTERTQKIFAFMPYGAGSQSGTLLTPTFSSNGTVSVNGQSQTSGISSQDFSNPVTYTVTSLNGLYTKDYVVSLQESGSVIYVDKNAVGRNNGTSWDDAFINLDTALEYVNSIDDFILQEVWITADEYEPILNSKNGFNVRSNLILRGGFEGFESTSNERTVDSENCLVNHTVLKRMPFSSNEESLFYANEEFTGTFTIDGFDIDLEQTANETFLDVTKVLNPIEATQNHSLEINNCLFNIKTQNSSCRFYYSEKDPSELHDTISKPTNNATIENTKINLDSTSKTFSVTSHTGQININNAKTNCPLYFVGNEVNIENSSFDNQLSSVYDASEPSMYFTNINNQDSYANIKNSYFNNMFIEAYYDTEIEDCTLENVALHTDVNGLSNLNILNSTMNLVDINQYALEYGSLCMKNSTLEAMRCRGSNLIQIEDSEIKVFYLQGWVSFQTASYYEGNSFIKNSTIITTGGSALLGGYIGDSTEYYASKDLIIENSRFLGCTNLYFYSENLTIKDSVFSKQTESSLYKLYIGTKNLVLQENEFDTSLLQSDKNYFPITNYGIGFDVGITIESAEIKNNTFGNLFTLSFGYNNNVTDRYCNFDNNYFKTGSAISFTNYPANLTFTNNTFEDIEYIVASQAVVSKYENNKVINKNSSRGYKYIFAKEFPYTEFNYDNFCYFNSSGELSFNNCIIEPCTQTYSLPQGDFTFNYFLTDFVANSGSYMTFNDCVINSDFENNGTVLIENCKNLQIRQLDNHGDFTINESYLKYTTITNRKKFIFNDSSLDGDYINCSATYAEYEFNNVTCSFIKTYNYGTFTINNSTITNGNQIENKGTLTINNSNVNLTSNDGKDSLASTGNLAIKGGLFNFNATQGGNLINAQGSLSINGGTFNLEHAGSYSPMYVACDATISDAKFNFTGDEYTNTYCVSFQNGTNGSTIKNCEFIIDKCGLGGIYIWQDELKIENSKFDINVYPQNSGYTCCGFYAIKSFSIDGGTYDLGNLSVYADSISIKNATVTTGIINTLTIAEGWIIDNSTINLNVTDENHIRNYSDNIKNTNFNFTGETSSSVWKNYSSSLAKCNFNFLNIKSIVGDTVWSGVMNLKTSCSILDCFFYGANGGDSSSGNKRGGAIAIEHTSGESSFIFENCTFSNNRITSSPNSGVWEAGGGGISVLSEANDCTVVFKDCNFMNNFSSTGTAYHLYVNNWNSAYTGCNILFSGTNTMTGPKCPVQIFNGGKSYENEAIYVSGFTVTGTIN